MKEEIEVCACEESLSLRKELSEANAKVASYEKYRKQAGELLLRVVTAARKLDCGCEKCVSDRVAESSQCIKDVTEFVRETQLS